MKFRSSWDVPFFSRVFGFGPTKRHASRVVSCEHPRFQTSVSIQDFTLVLYGAHSRFLDASKLETKVIEFKATYLASQPASSQRLVCVVALCISCVLCSQQHFVQAVSM